MNSVSTTLRAQMPHSDLTGRDWGRAYNDAVLTNDAEAVIKTFTQWDTHFVRVSPPGEGEQSLATSAGGAELTIAFEFEQIARQYRYALANVLELADIQITTEINEPWFQYAEEWYGSRRPGEVDPTFRNAAYFKPAWTDGALGEVAIDRPQWAYEVDDAGREIGAARRLDALESAWRGGDEDLRLAQFGEAAVATAGISDLTGSVRHRWIARSPSEMRDMWREPAFGRVLEMERLHYRVSSWHVFAAYAVELDIDGRTVERETAVLYPLLQDGKFQGEFSYSLQTEAARM